MASDRLSLQKAKGPKGAFEKGLLLELTKLGTEGCPPRCPVEMTGKSGEPPAIVEHRTTERFQRSFFRFRKGYLEQGRGPLAR